MGEPDFGLLVAQRRKELGMSQEDLSKLVGVSRPYITQVENGRFPSDEKFGKILIALKMPIQKFFLEAAGDYLDDNERLIFTILGPFYEKLGEYLTSEEYIDVMSAYKPIEEFQAAMAKTISEMPVDFGPVGWSQLAKKDRDLIQRLVNRLPKTEKSAE